MVKNQRTGGYRQIERESSFTDKVEMEKLIFFLTADEIAVLTLRHLGYRSEEIYKIIGLHNMTAYRKLTRSLNMRIYLFKKLYKSYK